MTVRKLWLDALRGVAMILVVYGHCVRGWTDYFIFTSPVKMPLFFIISGYLFNPYEGNQVVFYKHVITRLIIPWIVLGLFPYTHPVDRFLQLVSGQVLWFMPCFIIAEILWFYIHKYLSKRTIYVVLSGFVACTIGFIMHYFKVLRYAMIDTAFIVQFFFVIGYILRCHEEVLNRMSKWWLPLAGVVYIIMGMMTKFFWSGRCIDVHLNRYYNIPYCMLMIMIGCIALFFLFKVMNFRPQWLVYIGQNTLPIYLLHGFVIRNLFVLIMDYFNIIELNPILLGGVKTATACVLCCVFAGIANKYCPKLVGK